MYRAGSYDITVNNAGKNKIEFEDKMVDYQHIYTETFSKVAQHRGIYIIYDLHPKNQRQGAGTDGDSNTTKSPNSGICY